MQDRQLPSRRSTIRVDVSGAQIQHDQPAVETREIYLPKHEEYISHIALDIGGSLAKCVYFTRTNGDNSSSSRNKRAEGAAATASNGTATNGHTSRPPSPNGYLNPTAISPSISQHHHHQQAKDYLSSRPQQTHHQRHSSSSSIRKHLRRRSSSSGSGPQATVPGGRLNFVKFETDEIDDCLSFIDTLIQSSSESHGVSVQEMKRSVKIMATGGGAHLYYDKLTELGLEVRREEEMDCLITGLTFLSEIPTEVYWYSDELVEAVSHPNSRNTTPAASSSKLPPSANTLHQPPPPPRIPRTLSNAELPRPSPDPPRFSLVFDEHPKPQYPCMLVNIGSGVSIVKIDEQGHFERISGTSLGGGTLWGLLSLLTGAESFDEMLTLSEQGDNSTVDMLVGDIYGADYNKIGLKSSTIASSFGKVFRKGQTKKRDWKPEDISRSLLYAVSNNIGQIAYMNAEKHNLDRIYFGGCFIRGHAATMATLSYAIRFWSKGTKTAMFLRHEGFLGSVGAWLKNIDVPAGHSNSEEPDVTRQ